MQQRGSDRLNVRRDDEMKHQLQGMLRSEHPTRAEEWHDPEPSAEDDPRPGHGGPVAPAGSDREREQRDEDFRFELARYLRRSVFPAGREDLLHALADSHGPDRLVDEVRGLPPDETYANVQQVATALGHRPRS